MPLMTIRLADDRINDWRIFVEDNIGESIHIHWNFSPTNSPTRVRIELTVNEFLSLGQKLENALIKLEEAEFEEKQ